MPINLRKDRNRPRSPLAIPTAPSRDQSPPIDELFTGIQPLLVERKFHNDRVGMKLGGGREPKGEITTPLKEYLDRFRGTKVYKVEKFVNRGGGGDVLNVAV